MMKHGRKKFFFSCFNEQIMMVYQSILACMQTIHKERYSLRNAAYCMSQQFISITVAMARSNWRLCIVYHRVLKIPEYCAVNVICLENKVKPEI